MLNSKQSTKIYKARVALRGDIVKDDSGSYAVFTEQGSSASQMAAAKVMDVISIINQNRHWHWRGVTVDPIFSFSSLNLTYWQVKKLR